MKLGAKVLATASGLGLAAAMLATVPANADTAFSVTIKGKTGSMQNPSASTLKNLKHTSMQKAMIANQPANVGLYMLHCLIPTDGKSAPTLCDASKDAAILIPALETPNTEPFRQEIEVNAEFYGQNPNPQAANSPRQKVDCREQAANPYGAACAIYILGSGKDSANPAYMRIFPTKFKDVKKRKNDAATVKMGKKVIGTGQKPTLKFGQKTPISVQLKSGIVPDLQSDNCQVDVKKKSTTIEALYSDGTCDLLITSPGNSKFNMLVRTVTFKLAPSK